MALTLTTVFDIFNATAKERRRNTFEFGAKCFPQVEVKHAHFTTYRACLGNNCTIIGKTSEAWALSIEDVKRLSVFQRIAQIRWEHRTSNAKVQRMVSGRNNSSTIDELITLNRRAEWVWSHEDLIDSLRKLNTKWSTPTVHIVAVTGFESGHLTFKTTPSVHAELS
ncbi:hypothetical protein CLF_110756 [Clonorchis sinensis]|uniref:Uncharacterized protein n=1 Tax=Clonorchis sinensis TaxID=79923 RepID=G7YTU9_CLOSI|nr:hypothetical protein CLF_110756 [Clonorchis sinensis]